MREDIIKAIRAVYRKVFPDGSVRPRFTRVNALTDSGMSELTSEICRVVAPEKLGSMQQVLSGDLKRSALAGRSRRHRDTVNRIAARLALHTVDQKAGDQDLIAVAAEGVCRYGVLTFEASDLAAALHQEMGRTPGEPDPGRQAAAAGGGDQSPGGPDRHPGDHRRRTCHGTGRVRVNRTPPVPVEIQDATGTGFFDVVDAYLDPAAQLDADGGGALLDLPGLIKRLDHRPNAAAIPPRRLLQARHREPPSLAHRGERVLRGAV